ncbi:MAG TPA: YkgJ family cysteine cluster protein [Polyangiaceae bacterium]|nr:YkgJ family cysteine cluster protein [Polyangiaceae bacterium]
MSNDSWSFRCTGCGKCCNTAPELSVPELFRHQHRFIGRLGVRRVPRLARDGTFDDARSDLLLFTHAWYDEASARCPALDADGRCAIHDDHKPLVCRIAPLDALVPDGLQHQVLERRARDAAYFRADCIAPGLRAGFDPLVRRLEVVDPAAHAALARRRAELALEKRHWGDGVYRLLESELFEKPEELAKIPRGGFMSLSIAPVLMVLAETSARCRARCIAYLDAQLTLARSLGAAQPTRAHAGP